jgi:hypothetical protein
MCISLILLNNKQTKPLYHKKNYIIYKIILLGEHTKKGKIIICVIYGLARKAAFRVLIIPPERTAEFLKATFCQTRGKVKKNNRTRRLYRNGRYINGGLFGFNSLEDFSVAGKKFSGLSR